MYFSHGRSNNNNNNNNGPSGGQRGVEKSVSYIAGFVVQGQELRIPRTQVLWEKRLQQHFCCLSYLLRSHSTASNFTLLDFTCRRKATYANLVYIYIYIYTRKFESLNRTIKSYIMSDFQTFKLPIFQSVTTSNFQTFKLSNCQRLKKCYVLQWWCFMKV